MSQNLETGKRLVLNKFMTADRFGSPRFWVVTNNDEDTNRVTALTYHRIDIDKKYYFTEWSRDPQVYRVK